MRAADGLMLVGIACLVWVIYRAQRNTGNQFDLFDLVMADGKLSRVSVAFMTTLVATTYIMLRLTMDGKLTEGYFAAYSAAWIAPLISKMFTAPTTTSKDNNDH